MPSSNNTVNIDANKLMQSVTLNVNLRGIKLWNFKFKLALKLIELAGWIVGCHLEIETCPDPYCPCRDGDPCHYEGDNPMIWEGSGGDNETDISTFSRW